MKRVSRHHLFSISFFLFALTSCSVSKQISKKATDILLKDSAISQGHIGISMYEPSTGKYWYEHDAEKYFIPASNTKLFSLYAGMKYLGDSLVGLRYSINQDTTYIKPSGDPTFLLKEFPNQPVFKFLKNQHNLVISTPTYVTPFGNGWAWNDYRDDYMAPRSVFPIYGNLVSVRWVPSGNIQVSTQCTIIT